MKRFLICAAAAIVALASCSKTQVVYNDAPEEIGFKAVSGVMTKAATALEQTEDIGVFAHLYDNTIEGNEYFGNTQFMYQSDSWKAAKYWPVSNGLIFTIYSPYNGTKENENDVVTWNAATKTLSFPSGDNSNTQTDFLYGKSRPNATRVGSSENAAVSVELGHALAMVTINVTATEDNVVTLKSLVINNTRQNETCTVSYAPTPVSVKWTENGELTANHSLVTSEIPLTSTVTSKTYLVVPIDALDTQTISLTYTLAGSDNVLSYATATKDGETPNLLGTTWSNGKNYIYNISIGPKEIKFSPSVVDWDANTDGVDENDDTDITI